MTQGYHPFPSRSLLPGRHLIWVLIGCCCLFASACSRTGVEKLPSQIPPAPRPSSTPAATIIMPHAVSPGQTVPPTLMPGPTSGSTLVIIFHPDGVPTQKRAGSCWSVSDVLSRADAWRCMADNEIYDPCFGIPGNSQAVICATSPLSDSPGFVLNLTGSFPARGTVPPISSVWAFELADGTNCTFLGGATAAFEGKRINYSCSDGWYILGELQDGLVWTARKVRLSSDFSSIEESIPVFIKIVWK
jgi:hypothetical protein